MKLFPLLQAACHQNCQALRELNAAALKHAAKGTPLVDCLQVDEFPFQLGLAGCEFCDFGALLHKDRITGFELREKTASVKVLQQS